ncbi:MAG TPA: hypothetical protein VHF25_11565 [Nitriliruptorales bacterium]|nr:hypothetical protein [Nitriliruptorales bacterium]
MDARARRAYRRVAIALVAYADAEQAIREEGLHPLTVEFVVARLVQAERHGLTPVGPGEPKMVADTFERVLDVAARFEPSAVARVRAHALGHRDRGRGDVTSRTHVPFPVDEPFMSSARKAAMRRRSDDPRTRPPTWALAAARVRYFARHAAGSPVVRTWTATAVVSAVIFVGLNETTPGPVIAEWLRLTAVVMVVAVAGITVWLASDRWGRRRAALGTAMAWLTLGVASAYVLVGLHQQTPGPVLDPGVRWLIVAVLLATAGLRRISVRRGR